MRRNRRDHGRSEADVPPVPCPCGALVEGRGALCRKCRRRLRWLQRMKGRRREQWRDVNRFDFFLLQVVSPR